MSTQDQIAQATARSGLHVVGGAEVDHSTHVDPANEAAFFRRYAPYVARIGLRILGRDTELDDLVQDVFAVAFRRRHQVRDLAAVKGWLATITVRSARLMMRKRKLRAAVGLAPPHERALVDPDASPEQRALLQRVYECLDEIPVEHRLAWTLRHVDGRKLDEVATLCGCSLATAKRRIAAAHAHLQESLSDG